MTKLLTMILEAYAKLEKKTDKLRLELAEIRMDPEQFEEHVADQERLGINHASYEEIIKDLEMERASDKEEINNLKMELDKREAVIKELQMQQGGESSLLSEVGQGQKEEEDNVKEAENKDGDKLEVIVDKLKELAEFVKELVARLEVKVKLALVRDE